MPAPFKAITVSQPAAGARWLGRPLQRNMRVMATRQQDLLSADEVAKAMEFQRRRSQVKAAGAPQAAAASLQVDSALEDDLAMRRKLAREWITPWLAAANRSRSQKVLAEARARVEMMSAEQQEAAMQRLLGKTAPEGSAPEPTASVAETNGAPDSPTTVAEDHPSRYAPSEVLEDGAVIYSMALLQAFSYEDVLAP